MDAHIIDIYVSSADVQQVTRIALGNVASSKVEAKSGTDKKWALTCRLGQSAQTGFKNVLYLCGGKVFETGSLASIIGSDSAITEIYLGSSPSSCRVPKMNYPAPEEALIQ